MAVTVTCVGSSFRSVLDIAVFLTTGFTTLDGMVNRDGCHNNTKGCTKLLVNLAEHLWKAGSAVYQAYATCNMLATVGEMFNNFPKVLEDPAETVEQKALRGFCISSKFDVVSGMPAVATDVIQMQQACANENVLHKA